MKKISKKDSVLQVLPLLLANANEMEMDAKIVKYLITVNDTFQIFRTQMTFFFRKQEHNIAYDLIFGKLLEMTIV